jgi:glycosyltransferase involved in cell wall biosynthesis
MIELLQRLDKKQFEVFVICKEPGDMTRELARLGIKVIFVPSLVRRINPVLDALALLKLTLLFRRHKFEIIHTHSSKTGLIGRVAARLAGVKHVFHTVHGLPFHEFSGAAITGFYAFLERIGSYFSTQIIFVNNEERRLAIGKKMVPASMAATIYNGANLALVKENDHASARQSFRNVWKMTPDDFVIGYVGRLWEQKDPDTLIRLIRSCGDLPAKFVIVGDGPFKPRFEMEFKENCQVIMTGWMADPMTVYPAIDLLVLPSLWEGLSMTLIEAMAFGKPLIASDIKGNRECVWPGQNGFLCTPRAPDEFRAAIETLFSDRDLYQRMSRASRQFSRRYFDAEKNCQAVIALYHQAIESYLDESVLPKSVASGKRCA